MRAQIGRGRSSHRGDDSSHLALEIVMPKRNCGSKTGPCINLAAVVAPDPESGLNSSAWPGWGCSPPQRLGGRSTGSRRFDRGPERAGSSPYESQQPQSRVLSALWRLERVEREASNRPL